MQPELTRLLALKDHPLRLALVAEMHVRRFPAFAAPARLTQLVMFTGEEQIAETRRAAEQLCERFGVRPPMNGRYFARAARARLTSYGNSTPRWARTRSFVAVASTIRSKVRC